MKKQIGLIGALALAIGGAAQAAQPVEIKTGNETNISAPAKRSEEKKLPAKRREILPDGLGGLMMPSIVFASRGPKEYGQWLQATGRQKWNKGKKK